MNKLSELDEAYNWQSKIKDLKSHRKNFTYLYQYRSFKSFWSIVKNDCFWATNARFSNDSEEQKFGMNLLKDIFTEDEKNSFLKQNKKSIQDEIASKESFIVCFCEDDDKLSQWRGYAPLGGVSIGFDFDMTSPFMVLHNDTTQAVIGPYKQKSYERVYAKCYGVRYLDKNTGPNEIRNSFGIQNKNDTSPEDKIILADKEVIISRISKMIPYIKHKGFIEENEWRLAFHSDEMVVDKCIRFKDDEDMRIPYIVIKPGDIAYEKRPCIVRIRIKNDLTALVELQKALNGKLPKKFVVNCEGEPGELGDTHCYGCTRRRWYSPGYGFKKNLKCKYIEEDPSEHPIRLHPDEPNSIIISQGKEQEVIFNIVHKWAETQNNVLSKNCRIAVWCEGHLPIRCITIGPCRNKEEMKESIENYCSHIYWLKDVSINTSDIPFRPALR